MSVPNSYPIEIVEMDSFTVEAERLLTEDEVDGLKTYLAQNPEAGVVIKGAHGVRKIRWGLQKQNKGKLGGARAIYYYRDLNMPLYLLSVYAKSEKIDLSEKDKKAIKSLIGELINTNSEKTWNIIHMAVNGNWRKGDSR